MNQPIVYRFPDANYQPRHHAGEGRIPVAQLIAQHGTPALWAKFANKLVAEVA